MSFATDILASVLEDVAVDAAEESVSLRSSRRKSSSTPKTRRKKKMAAAGPTKAELQETLDQVASIVEDMLDPTLNRKELVEKAQELDSLINGDDSDDEDEDSDEDADGEADEDDE